MENNDYNILESAFCYVNDMQLGKAIRTIRSFQNSHPYLMYDNSLDGIEEDYLRMLDYMRRGFKDPEREGVYHDLLRRMYVVIADLRMAYRKQHERFFIELSGRARQYSFSHDRIKSTLENFVTDMAMLSLEPEETAAEKESAIYREHQNFMSLLFDDIMVSGQWKQYDSAFFEELLLSPIIDINDALLTVSAITLANISEFDINKFTVLVNVYRKGNGGHLRQRALAGWVLSMHPGIKVLPEQEDLIRQVCGTKNAVKDIVDMQKQMIFCMNAEKDNEKIQRDIIPVIMKNNSFNITRDGIIEKDDDPMEDIMRPDATDRRMEEMEEGLQKMINMQKSGSDIYFGGFSQMKRFPFFYTLSNWFTPFYINHPDLKQATGKLGGNKLMHNILEHGPFCESDKYSFTIAISTVIERIPENMREMLGNAEIMGPALPAEQQRSDAYIRRMYLQDLYRFFRLHPQRSALRNPFDKDSYVFVAEPVFENTSVHNHIADIAFFFHKHHDGTAMERAIERYNDNDDPKCQLLRAIYESVYNNCPVSSISHYERLMVLEPDNERGMTGLAREYMKNGYYGKAAGLYRKLSETHPENKGFVLNYCIAMTKSGQYEEAVSSLYRLDYEMPDDINVIRVLAWALMGLNRLEQASKEYDRLLTHDKHNGGDYLNAGYCQWFKGNVSMAVSMFRTFLEHDTKTSIENEFSNDRDTLEEHGLSSTDIQLMTDLVDEKNDSY